MAEQDQDDQDELESEHDSNDAEYGLSGVRRPMNAFFIFCKRHRDIVREKYPHLENRSITKILGEWWANLEPSEKTSYTALAKQYKEAFMKANPDFKWYKLPTPPTRTLITRPSNHRCLQSQKDKKHQKQPSCGITLGKLADDTQLGGLSSLISPTVSASNADSDTSAISVFPSHSTSISKNILKPPKKRYLVNGEFKCHTEDTRVIRDHQTENACSALLEFAEICANSENQKTVSSSSEVTDSFSEFNTSVGSPKKGGISNCIISLPLSVSPSKKAEPLSTTYPTHCDVQKAEKCSLKVSFSQPAATSSSIKSASNDVSEITVQQDQPLNLCKEKEKTITASHQQLIDHLVDKFLCGPTDSQSNHFASVLNPQFHNILIPNKYHRNISRLGKEKPAKTDFVMSVAIESAVDQAYNKDFLKTGESEQVQQSKFSERMRESNDETNKNDLNKLKDASITDSKMPTETTYCQNLFFKSETLGKDRISNAEININNSQDRDQTNVLPKGLTIKRTFDSISELKSGVNANKLEINKAADKSECKLISPPKKSRIWCNTFMNEQLKIENSTENSNNNKACIIPDPLSPVRRNLQRTCKGRRYQALITEGLLQSAKERKPAANRKSICINEKAKSEYTFATDGNAVFSTPRKKRKKDSGEKSKALLKSQEFEKCIFDLEEKIAALPKCSIETLNKRKKAILDSETIRKNSDSTESSNIVNPSCSKTNFKKSPDAKQSISEIVTEDSSSMEINFEDAESFMSSGRFKTGNFDLEKHIASLPKCDIEMMNKRKHKKN